MPSRLAAAGRIAQSGQTRSRKSTTPLRARLLADPMAFGDLFTGESGRTVQNDTGPDEQSRRAGALSAPTLKLPGFLIAEQNFRGWSSHNETLKWQLRYLATDGHFTSTN